MRLREAAGRAAAKRRHRRTQLSKIGDRSIEIARRCQSPKLAGLNAGGQLHRKKSVTRQLERDSTGARHTRMRSLLTGTSYADLRTEDREEVFELSPGARRGGGADTQNTLQGSRSDPRNYVARNPMRWTRLL